MTQKRAGNVINSIAVWVVRLTGAGIFLFLSWYALRYTQYMDPAVGEFPVNIRDSMGQNLFCVIVVLLIYAGFRMAGRRLSNRPKFLLWSSIGLLTMVTLWMCIAGHWWISAIVRPPEGDQLYAYVAALSFAEGNYSSILPDGYCGIYPHQLGFTAILELFFKITGNHGILSMAEAQCPLPWWNCYPGISDCERVGWKVGRTDSVLPADGSMFSPDLLYKLGIRRTFKHYLFPGSGMDAFILWEPQEKRMADQYTAGGGYGHAGKEKFPDPVTCPCAGTCSVGRGAERSMGMPFCGICVDSSVIVLSGDL